MYNNSKRSIIFMQKFLCEKTELSSDLITNSKTEKSYLNRKEK